MLLEASGSLEGSWRAGRQHRHEYWVTACSPVLRVADGGDKGRLRVPHSGVDPPDRRRWGAAGTSILPQQAQKKEAPLVLLFLHCARGHRASEPPTYMVDDLRGQELPS